jgi:hypothetical protein
LNAKIDLSPAQGKIGEAINLQQINILEIEYLKLDLEESNTVVPENLKQSLDRLLSHSVKTSRILQELSRIELSSVSLSPGTK